MGLYDTETGDISDLVHATNVPSTLGGQGAVDSAIDVVTKFVPLSIGAAINGVINTPIQLANMFGADIEPLKMSNELQSLGLDSYDSYYKEHTQGVEAAGFIAGSLVPGLYGVKAMKAIQGGFLGETAARATNLLMPATDKIVKGAEATILSGDQALFPGLAADKFKAISLGFRDQAVQSLAFETAAAAAMQGSPLMKDQSWGDMLSDMAIGIGFGTVVGGGLEAYAIRSKFQQAYLAADKATKDYETVRTIFKDDGSTLEDVPLAGAKMAAMFDHMWSLPKEELSTLAGRKLSTSTNRALNEITVTARELSGTNNEKFADSFVSMIRRMYADASMSKEDALNKMGTLVGIRPVGDADVAPAADYFFVNKFHKGNQLSPAPLTEVFSNVAHDGADLSKRYQMRPYSNGAEIGKWYETFTTPDGLEMPRFRTAEEAWEGGKDIFLAEKGQIYVNPNAPNLVEVPLEGMGRPLKPAEYKSLKETGMLPKDAAPLYSAPTVLNVLNGNVVTNVVRVLGDYPGEVKVINRGVTYGRREFSPQTTGSVLTTTTETEDAMARYLWTADRGIRAKDTIVDSDLPTLETLFYQATKSGDFGKHVAELEKKGVTFASGDPLSQNPQQLLTKIQGAKDDFIHDLMLANPKMSIEEVARRANVSQDYINNGLKATKPEDFMANTPDLARVNHVQLSYDIGNTSRMDGQIVRGMVAVQQKIGMIRDNKKAALSKYAGEGWENLWIDGYSSKDATIAGPKPGILSFTNAAMGTLAQRVQTVGGFLTRFIQKQIDADEGVMSSHFATMRSNPVATSELNSFIAARHSTNENWTWLPREIVEQEMPTVVNKDNVAVLRRSLVMDKDGNITGWNPDYQPEGFYPGVSLADHEPGATPKGLKTWYELNDEHANFEHAWQQVNDRRLKAVNDLYTAQGLPKKIEPGNLYAPPIDTNKYPFIALVKPIAGKAFADDGISVITAASKEGLEQKMAMLRNDFDIFTKDDIKTFHKIQGDYDSQLNFNTGQANGEMRRRGILNDIFPNVNVEATLKDYIDYGRRQNFRIARNYVEVGNDQLFSELDQMGKMYENTATSQVSWWASKIGRQAENPYRDYINTALGIRNENYTLWRDGQEKLEATADSAFRMARSAFIGVQKGVLSYDQASAISERFGLGNPWARGVDALKSYQEIANQLPPTRILSRFVNTMNTVQSATAITYDGFQSLINLVSAPILTVAETLSSSAALKQMAIKVPGTPVEIPSVTKLMAQAIGDWFNKPLRDSILPGLKQLGVVRESLNDFAKMQDNMGLPIGTGATEQAVDSKIKTVLGYAAKITGGQYVEDFNRFISARMATRLYSAAGVSGSDLIDNMITFVNRTHGNYIASQRPIAFQGPIGAAMSLFQTYQLNFFQQMFRYVQNGEAKTLGTMMALQGGLFGIQGLPGAQLINQHLIGNLAMNPAHKDIYSTTMNTADKDLGEWLLYGAVSNITHTGLYSRGDINPRSVSILPLNPLEFPAISGAINFGKAIFQLGQKVVNGAAIVPSIFLAMEHNGLSRPMTGLGQLMQGFTTTANGDLISRTTPGFSDGTLGWSELQTALDFTRRIAGARPLDEAVSLDALYRSTAYEAKDRTRMQQLGSAAKTYLYGNNPMPASAVTNFAAEYAQSGGFMPNFGKEIISWTKDANISRANEVFMHLAHPLAQQMMMSIGGTKLPDYAINPPASASTAVSQP